MKKAKHRIIGPSPTFCSRHLINLDRQAQHQLHVRHSHRKQPMTIMWSRSPNNLEQDRQLSLQALDQWITIKYQQTKSGIYRVSTIITTALEMTRMALICLTVQAINSLLN